MASMKIVCLLLVSCVVLPYTLESTVYIYPDLQNVTCDPIQQPCHTLLQYSDVTTFNSSTVFVLLPGNHTLTYHFRVTHINNLTLSGDTAHSGSVTITCQSQGQFTFKGIHHVSITSIMFIGCDSIRVSSVSNLTIFLTPPFTHKVQHILLLN